MKDNMKIIQPTNNSVCTFPIFYEVSEEDVDERFTKVKIWLMHTGENLNGGYFEKSVIEDALPTLEYIPIVGFIKENKITGEKDFDGHKYILVKEDGKLKPKYIGSAYGVILSTEDNNAHFEERVCDDGVTREFLVVDGIMWNMFEDSSDIINRDLVKPNSMELHNSLSAVEGYDDDEDGLFHFTKFEWRATCILGEDVSPAMMNSTIEVQYSVSDFVQQLQDELYSKIEAYKQYTNTQQGGVGVMSKVNTEPTVKEPTTDFAQTALSLIDDISNIVRDKETIKDYWGYETARYSFCDIQDETVIVCDRADHYNYYSVAFTIDGDKPVIDFETKKRVKVQFVEYVDGEAPVEGAFNFADEMESFEKSAQAEIDKITNERDAFSADKDKALDDYTAVKTELDEIKPKYQEYVAAEEERIKAENDARKDEIISNYETALGANEQFTAIKDGKDNMTVDEIESQCAVLYAKTTLYSQVKVKNEPMVAAVVEDKHDDNVVETKYGMITKGN